MIKGTFDWERGTDFRYYVFPLDMHRQRYNGVKILNEESFAYNYYDEQFKALSHITKGWPEIDITTAKKIINSEYARSGGSVTVIGVELSTDLMLSWGIYLILGAQLYFLLVLRELNNRADLFGGVAYSEVFPWLLLYRGPAGLIAFYFSVIVLPLLAAGVAIWANVRTYPFREAFGYIQVLIASLLIVIAAFELAREEASLRQAVKMLRGQ